jgi:hypothetical protein
VEQVGQHADAALLDLRRLRVLGVVDVVAMQVLGDHPLRLGLHPRRHEGGEVAERDAVQHELFPEQPHRVGGRHPGRRQPMIRRVAAQERVSVHPLGFALCSRLGTVRRRRRGLGALMDRHGALSLGFEQEVGTVADGAPDGITPLG